MHSETQSARLVPARLSAPSLTLFLTLAYAPSLVTAQTVERQFWAHEAPLALHAMLLMMGLTLGLLTWLQRGPRWQWLLVALMGVWVLRDLLPDEPSALIALLKSGLAGLLAWCLIGYLLRAIQQMPRWLDAALLVQTIAMMASATLLGATMPWLSKLWTLVLALECASVAGWQMWLRHKALQREESLAARQDWSAMVMLLSASLLAAALELAARHGQWLAGDGLLTLAAPLLLLGLGLQVVAGTVRARRAAELQLLQMERLMEERVAEVERSFSDIAEQKLEQVTERERKRIAADLHDDLGAKLLTIVHTSESDRISTLAREALEEMRLSVRGLTGKPVHLLDALGDWRAEVVSRLGQANILAEWKSPAEEVSHTLPARAYVQTTRILRESVSNIIKHSGATHCTVSCAVQEGDFLVIIQDNGQGISGELDGRLDKGHGMASMKARAKQMHGQCLVESGPGWGTVIRLTIPL